MGCDTIYYAKIIWFDGYLTKKNWNLCNPKQETLIGVLYPNISVHPFSIPMLDYPFPFAPLPPFLHGYFFLEYYPYIYYYGAACPCIICASIQKRLQPKPIGFFNMRYINNKNIGSVRFASLPPFSRGYLFRVLSIHLLLWSCMSLCIVYMQVYKNVSRPREADWIL